MLMSLSARVQSLMASLSEDSPLHAKLAFAMKDAGKEDHPVKGGKVTATDIKAAMIKSGYLKDYYDYSKVEFDPHVELHPGSHQPTLYTTWRVYLPGKFGDRADYAWGTVTTWMEVTPQGVKCFNVITVDV